MSLFSECECCDEIAGNVCRCSTYPRYFCDSHTLTHIKSSGEHSIRAALATLSAHEVSHLRKAFEKYQESSIRQAFEKRNSVIDRYFSYIRYAEEEYKLRVKSILNGAAKKEINELCLNESIPLFSDSFLVQSLLSLKQTENFSEETILELLLSITSVRDLNHTFPVESSSTQTAQNPTSSVQTYANTISTIEAFPSQVFLKKPVNPQWKLFKQIQGHNDSICSIAVSECEQYFASASFDKTIKIWELETLKLIRTLKGHTNYVISVAFLGNRIVSGSLDKTMKIWKGEKCKKTLNLHSSGLTSVAVSSSKDLIVSGSNDRTVVVYSVERHGTLHTLRGHHNSVTSVSFSPNDKEIVSGSLDRTIKLWKTETGELLKTFSGHSNFITYVNYSGEFILSSSCDHTAKVWNSNADEAILTLTGHSSCVVCADLWNNIAVSLAVDDKIILGDIRTGRIIQTLKGHGNYDAAYYMDLKYLQGGMFIVSAGKDKNIKVWKRAN